MTASLKQVVIWRRDDSHQRRASPNRHIRLTEVCDLGTTDRVHTAMITMIERTMPRFWPALSHIIAGHVWKKSTRR
jgi:hypothetical protein